MSDVNALVGGALAMGYLIVALFFLRFWRQTRESLFGSFALSFALLGGSRVALSLLSEDAEDRHYLYGLRLLAFVVLLVGIIRKNLQSASPEDLSAQPVEDGSRERSAAMGRGAR